MSKQWLAKPEETTWSAKVERALEWRKHYTKEENWSVIQDYYRHNFAAGEGDMPHFNLIYMMGTSLIPNLVFQSPGIINRPTRADMTYMASLWDSIDNWWIQKSEMREVAREVALSSYLFNTTATQIAMDFGSDADKVNRDSGDMFEKLNGTTNRARGNNVPWLDYVPPHRFILSVGTRTMRNCRWAGKLVSMPTKALKGQPGMKNVCPTPLPDAVRRMERFTWEKRNEKDWTHFWEIHDAESRKWFWLGTHGKYILPPEQDPLQVFGLPFEVVSFNKNTDSLFGTPDAEYIKSQQLEGDEIRKHAMYLRRLSLSKCIYNADVISPEAMAEMLSATVSPAVPARLGTGDEVDVRKHVYMFAPPTSFTLHQEAAKGLLNDAQLINGFGPNQMGTFAPGRRTKYETQVVESNNTTRLAYRRNEIGDMIKGHTYRANILMAKYWTQDIVQQVVGVDGALYWVKAAPDQLRNIEDGLVTEVNVESLAPVSRERRKMEASNLISMLGTMQEAGMNTLPLIKQLLSTYEWIDIRQVLPQMGGEYELAAWQADQARLQEAGAGPKAAANLAGVATLADRAPSEGQPDVGTQQPKGRE